MKAKVLIVEDEKLMQDLLYEYFVNDGYEVFCADDGVMAMEVFRQHDFAIVLLDVMMPKMDGFSVCRRISKESKALIVMLTVREEEDDKLLGFELGADEYVTKPFSPKVLVARVNALLDRYNKESLVSDQEAIKELKFGSLAICEEGYRVNVGEDILDLTKKEFDLLVLLANNQGRVLKRELILQQIWGEDYYGDGRVVDTNIKTLRKKLRQSNHIKTVINVGYKFQYGE